LGDRGIGGEGADLSRCQICDGCAEEIGIADNVSATDPDTAFSALGALSAVALSLSRASGGALDDGRDGLRFGSTLQELADVVVQASGCRGGGSRNDKPRHRQERGCQEYE